MANGEISGTTLTPVKIIMICLAITVAINGWSLYLYGDLREELQEKTDKRYRLTDAERDFKLVTFRFKRNEEKIQRCENFIESHRKDHRLNQ